ncbi:MAG: PhzF family phenazine biosynthesis protein [Cyclobacteriaceae bacterium]
MEKAIYHLLDVFTNQRFGGNQLAVFPDARNVPEDQMQEIARELNLSETVFILPKTRLGGHQMRIFTPATELPTAGHPTIGTAFLLGRDITPDLSDRATLLLDQKIGLIEVEIAYKNQVPIKATMRQPLPKFGAVYDVRKMFTDLLSLNETSLLDHPIQEIACGVPYILIPLNSLEAVKNIKFRLDLWEQMKDKVNGAFIYAFTPSGEQEASNLHGRMFAPEGGILEDPATGSANGPLGCYVTHYDILKGPFVSEQGFEMGRPSIIHIDIQQSGDHITAVHVGGESVFVGQGELYL